MLAMKETSASANESFMRLRLIFETHATSVDNEAGLASGWFDVALSTTGEEQARLLGVRRHDDHLTSVYCSDRTRSFHTAKIAFADRPFPIVRDARLRECNYGDLTRQPISEIEQRRVHRHAFLSLPAVNSVATARIESAITSGASPATCASAVNFRRR